MSEKKNFKSNSWNPDQYHRFQNERSQPFFDLLNLVEKKERMNVVDLGCGTGELTKVLHETTKADKTLGIDDSPAMLLKAANSEGPTLHFKQIAIESFLDQELKSQTQYDLVFSNAALQWCPDHPELFKKISKVLKPGGQLAVQMPANHDYFTHILADQLATQDPWRQELKGFRRGTPVLTPEFYANLFFHLGLKKQSVSLHVYPHVLESREGVMEWIKGTLLVAFESRLSEKTFYVF